MATKRKKVRKTRRSCKNGKLKRPIKTKSGRKRKCKKRKTKRRRKYKMMRLDQLASRNVADYLRGDIDKRIETISNRKDIPYNTKIDIIEQLEKDRELISEFYEAKVSKDINENNIFIQYIESNEKNKVKTVLKYYPEYANAIRSGFLRTSIFSFTRISEYILSSARNTHFTLVSL